MINMIMICLVIDRALQTDPVITPVLCDQVQEADQVLDPDQVLVITQVPDQVLDLVLEADQGHLVIDHLPDINLGINPDINLDISLDINLPNQNGRSQWKVVNTTI